MRGSPVTPAHVAGASTHDESAFRAGFYPFPPSRRRICRLCATGQSVAEISAHLHLPLGVTRILVADLAEAGLVSVHDPQTTAFDGGPDFELLNRVLSGLRAL
ncbi:DUF742 domain-containing protein [Streptomyces sp. 142MFCol3.1]|uniref:DUF742 domain-containing protein n=1 Tax=Streptomyces sp. 142MFCol3.1 TaxID=1172179 RepID=UPI0009977E2E